MKSQKSFCLFLAFCACLFSFSHAGRNFYVGGKEGWVVKPKENYNDWSGRLRFQVNDTLIFKYEKGSDSVLLVDKDDYNKCGRKNPVKKLSDGNSEFKFPHSGPFYFISGEDDHCDKGQKFITVVLAVRHEPPTTHPPGPVAKPPKGSYPGPALAPKSPSPVSKPPQGSSPGPALGPSNPYPVGKPPKASSPGPALGPSSPYSVGKPPMASSPGPALGPSAPHPVSKPPKASSPAPGLGPSSPQSGAPGPAYSPTNHAPSAHPPEAATPSPSSSLSPSSSPVNSPPSPPQTTPSPSPTTPQVPSGGQTGNPSNISSPTSAPSKASGRAVYSIMVLAGSLSFSMVMGGF